MPSYIHRTLQLKGNQVATLLRLPSQVRPRGAILYVHGFSDYFFQDHVAEHFEALGFDFYAIDLRRCGRSTRAGDLPHDVGDLSEYFEELDLAATLIQEDGHDRLILIGHSTGGLTTPLWLHARQGHPLIGQLVVGLILINPWFDLVGSWFTRTIGTSLIKLIGRFAPRVQLGQGNGVYSMTLRRDHHGEWDFNLLWKPMDNFPVRAGWLRAIRNGHARLHRGLAIGVSVLVLRSSRSVLHPSQWSPELMNADIVLDVDDMVAHAAKLGDQVSVVAVENGMHDLFLSAAPVRANTFKLIENWIESSVAFQSLKS